MNPSASVQTFFSFHVIGSKNCTHFQTLDSHMITTSYFGFYNYKSSSAVVAFRLPVLVERTTPRATLANLPSAIAGHPLAFFLLLSFPEVYALFIDQIHIAIHSSIPSNHFYSFIQMHNGGEI